MEERESCPASGEELEALWQRFSDRLRRFIGSFGVGGDDVEDILQEVYLRIHCRIDQLRERSKMQSWIYQITRRAVFDHFRRQRPGLSYCECLPVAERKESGDAASTRLAQSLEELIAGLPPPYRSALLSFEIDGLPQKELARALGISYSGAKSRVQRARQMVKALLLECCHVEFDRRGAILDYYEHCCCCAGKK